MICTHVFLHICINTHFFVLTLSSPNSSQIIPTSPPTQFHVLYLFLKNKAKEDKWNEKSSKNKTKQNKDPKAKQNKQANKNNPSTHSHNSIHKHCVHFMLVSYSWAWGLHWRIVGVTPLTKTDFPSFNRLSLADSVLVTCGILCLLPSLSTWILSGLILCRSYACCHLLWVPYVFWSCV